MRLGGTAGNWDWAVSEAGIKVRAERKLGELTRDMPKQSGGDAMKARSQDVTELTLEAILPTYAMGDSGKSRFRDIWRVGTLHSIM